ncbi:RraA family protein [Streptomyces sp. 7N604]|uniref:RraA family protein n=1 Tax=Streptomyces sp. 7N604 TaxID=3457415 RepID=UPI003FD07050
MVDAMGRIHRHRCDVLDLVCPTPGRLLFGPAVTLSYFPSCGERLPADRYNFARLFYEAIGEDGRGAVLVMACNGHPEVSMGGGTKLTRVVNHGLAGVLADGRLRDFADLATYDMVTYCRGEALRWGGDVVTPFEANRPVVVAGVGIWPGDYVFADHSGAAVIPSRDVETVLEEAHRVVAADAAAAERIAQETADDHHGDTER